MRCFNEKCVHRGSHIGCLLLGEERNLAKECPDYSADTVKPEVVGCELEGCLLYDKDSLGCCRENRDNYVEVCIVRNKIIKEELEREARRVRNFKDFMEHLLAGGKIKKDSWLDNVYAHLSDDGELVDNNSCAVDVIRVGEIHRYEKVAEE